jgi:hypothetical protein
LPSSSSSSPWLRPTLTGVPALVTAGQKILLLSSATVTANSSASALALVFRSSPLTPLRALGLRLARLCPMDRRSPSLAWTAQTSG